MDKLALPLSMVLMLGCSTRPMQPTQPGAGSDSNADEGEAAPFVETARSMLLGRRAPAVTLELLDGTRVELARLLGQRPIYLKFWATWCVPCREQMPHLEATFHAHGDKLAVFAVDVGVDDPIENVREMVSAKHLTMPVAFDRDGSISEQFYLNVTPQHVVIDKSGIVRFVGHAVTPELESALAAVVGDSAPASVAAAPAVPAPVKTDLPALALDNGSKLELASRPHAPIALTFATLFCDSYIANSRPEIGAACAAHARQVEQLRRSHADLAWIIVAYPVWTDTEDIASFRKRLGVGVPIGIDRGNAWFRHFGVRDAYTTVLLDGSGAELGRVDGDGSGLAALIDKAR